MSRRTSLENLRDLNRVSMPNPGDLEAGLRQALREREDNHSPIEPHDRSSDNLQALAASSGSTTPTYTAPPMRSQGSQQGLLGMTPLQEEESENTSGSPVSSPEMQHISPTPSHSSSNPPDEFIDMGRLSRVPSYNTANSANLLNMDQSMTTGLPSYAYATASVVNSNLSVIPEHASSRSRSGSSASSTQQSVPETPRTTSTSSSNTATAPTVLRVTSTGGITNSLVQSYGSPQTFDDPLRRISLMRNLFSSR